MDQQAANEEELYPQSTNESSPTPRSALVSSILNGKAILSIHIPSNKRWPTVSSSELEPVKDNSSLETIMANFNQSEMIKEYGKALHRIANYHLGKYLKDLGFGAMGRVPNEKREAFDAIEQKMYGLYHKKVRIESFRKKLIIARKTFEKIEMVGLDVLLLENNDLVKVQCTDGSFLTLKWRWSQFNQVKIDQLGKALDDQYVPQRAIYDSNSLLDTLQ